MFALSLVIHHECYEFPNLDLNVPCTEKHCQKIDSLSLLGSDFMLKIKN